MSTQMPANKQGASCWKIGLISCAVIAVLLIGAMFVVGYFGYRYVAKDPAFKQMMTCNMHMHEVGAAIGRYQVRNGSFPQNLNQLVPTFLADPSNLHCPADAVATNSVSYTYYAPPQGAPNEFIMLTCDKHTFKGQHVTLKVRKDGKFTQH